MLHPYWSWTTAKRRKFWSAICLAALFVGLGISLWPLLPGLKLPAQRLAASRPVLRAMLPRSLKAPDTADVPLTGNWLLIPGINVRERIWEGGSLDVLWTHEGVWHQVGDLGHNLVLAGHRFQYLPPNTDTFYNMNKLKRGDAIIVVWDGKPHEYRVTDTRTVTPDHVEILVPTETPELTLYTCSDWQESRRLVVVAKPK